MVSSDHAIRIAHNRRTTAAARPWPGGRVMPATNLPDPVPAAALELELIAAARLDPRAFAPLYEAYVDLVWRYAMTRLGNRERAADATSLTFQRALSGLPSFEPERRGDTTTFRAWLMTIARNVVIDETRRAQPTASLDDDAVQPWLVDRQRGPETSAVDADERRRIDRALSQLPAVQRQIVELRLAGWKGVEIAALLGKSESAVKTAHFRAYATLRDLLAEPNPTQDASP
jgi:RNA polymerase sigma-70 factor, ECF subfamily